MYRVQFTLEIRRIKSSLSTKKEPSGGQSGPKDVLLWVLTLTCLMSILTGLISGDQSFTVEIMRYLFGWVTRMLELMLPA